MDEFPLGGSNCLLEKHHPRLKQGRVLFQKRFKKANVSKMAHIE